MIWASLLTNPLVRKFGIYALVALILVASVAAWKIQVTALEAERDTANQKIGTLETESKQLRSALEMEKLQLESANSAQAKRVEEQTKIEAVKHESTKQNIIIMQKPDNKPLADTRLTDDMLGILRQ
jgi:hypothetical protein